MQHLIIIINSSEYTILYTMYLHE